MAENYSVQAVLSAKDQGFTSTFGKAQSVLGSLASKVGSGLGFGVLMAAGQAAFSAITSTAGELVGTMNDNTKAWKTFEGNLSYLGKSKGDIAAVKSELQDFATKTIYSASDMASTYSQLEAVGIKSADKLVTGFGGLAAAATEPTQAMKTLSQQATQMASKPMVQWQDFKLMLEQTPAGIAAVAKEMGMSTQELVANVQNGKVKTEEFFAAVEKAGNSDAFQKMATTYQTVDQAMDGLKETLANKLQPAFDAVSQVGIKAITGIADKVQGLDVEGMVNRIGAAFNELSPYLRGVGQSFGVLKSAVAELVAPLGGMVSGFLSSISPMDMLKTALSTLSNVLSTVAGFIQGHAGAIQSLGAGFAKIAPYVGIAIAAFLGFRKVSGVLGTVRKDTRSTSSAIINSLGKGLSNVLQGAGKGISSAVQGIGKGISSAVQGIGKGLASAMKGIAASFNMMGNPGAIIAFIAVIGTLTAAIMILSTRANEVGTLMAGLGGIITSVGTAIGSIVSSAINAFAQALVTVSGALPTVCSALSQLSPLVTAVGTAISTVMSALPPVITAVGTAFSTLVSAVGSAVSGIIGALTPVVSIIADAAVRIAQAFAPVAGQIASAFAQIVSAVSSAVASIVAAIAPYTPCLAQMVSATSAAIQAVATAFSQIVSQISPILQSLATVIQTFGTTVSTIFTSAGEVISSFGSAVSSVLNAVANVITSIGTSANLAGQGFASLANGVATITALPLADMAASLGAVAAGIAGIVAAASGISGVATAFTGIAAAMSIMAGASAAAVGGIRGIVSGATAAQAALMTMAASAAASMASVAAAITSGSASSASAMTAGMAKVTQSTTQGLNKTVQVAKTSMSKFVQAISSTQGAASSAAGSVARAAVNALSSASSSAYSYGSNIGSSFANGIRSQLGNAQAAANQLAAIAAQAVAARAQIGSPSRVATKLGKWFGEGWVNGLGYWLQTARRLAEELIYIPDVRVPSLAAWRGALNQEYDYSVSGALTITVVSEIDGREVARSTYDYVSQEQQKAERREARKRGKLS